MIKGFFFFFYPYYSKQAQALLSVILDMATSLYDLKAKYSEGVLPLKPVDLCDEV
jgi:hypothetical protein